MAEHFIPQQLLARLSLLQNESGQGSVMLHRAFTFARAITFMND